MSWLHNFVEKIGRPDDENGCGLGKALLEATWTCSGSANSSRRRSSPSSGKLPIMPMVRTPGRLQRCGSAPASR
jgi:hypothetical protein